LQNKINYLGYVINYYGITPNPKNVQGVVDFPIPQNHKQIQQFLGLVSYFRKFINQFALIAKPLYDLLRKKSHFIFGPEQLQSFETLKNTLVSSPILCIYNPTAETELHCDASSHGFGAILLQKQQSDHFHPIFYFSHRTSEVEAKYHSFELECLAVIYALKRFHTYLQGINFKIITDCDSFRLTLSKKKKINPRISRWALFLENYNCEIEHRKSSKMTHVDALSRCHNILVLEENAFGQNLAISLEKASPFYTVFLKAINRLIHIDHYGPLEKNTSGKIHIFEIIDAFTKFIKLFAVKSTKSKEVVNCLKTYFQFYRRPSRIVSDRGTAFTSRELDDFLKINNITHVKVARISPKSNGQIERYNRDLTPMLSKLSLLKNKWDKFLPEVEFAMNNTYSRSTHKTPCMLLFGVNQRNSDDPLRIALSLDTPIGIDAIRSEAQENNLKLQVVIKNVDVTPGVSKKLLMKFRGPYQVKKILGNDRYLITDIDDFQVTQIPFESVCGPETMKLWLHNDD
jgi:hypothetical protein